MKQFNLWFSSDLHVFYGPEHDLSIYEKYLSMSLCICYTKFRSALFQELMNGI